MYTISDLERISKIKPHTIRIWEKRYALFNPQRTRGNHRLYGDRDLLRLLNVSRMVTAKFRISKVAAWNDYEMSQHISRLEDKIDDNDARRIFYTDELLTSALAYDEHRFLKVFEIIDSKNDFLTIWTDYLMTVMKRIGELWISKKNRPAQEHFLLHLIQRKLCEKIDQLPTVSSKSKDFLLFLPSGERNDLGLLMSQYCIKKFGFNVVYLGVNVPIINIERYAIAHTPNILLTHLDGVKIPKSFISLLQKSAQFSSEIVLVGQLNKTANGDVGISKNVVFIDTIRDFSNYLTELK